MQEPQGALQTRMTAPFARFRLLSPDATAQFAAALAPRLVPGDVILLEGPIGSGKTHFARALIQSRLRDENQPAEDVPSPTFTLVQTYNAGPVEIWHADLYRLTHPDEVEELGLMDAFDEAICLVEWPDRLGELRPDAALTIEFTQGEDENARDVALSGAPRWASLIEVTGQMDV